jgi:hypothetical protein
VIDVTFGHEEMENEFEDFCIIMVEVKVEMLGENEFQRKCRRADISSVGFGLFLYEGWSVEYKVLVGGRDIFLKCAAA